MVTKIKCPPKLKLAAEIYRDKGEVAPPDVWIEAQKEIHQIIETGGAHHYDLAIAEFHKICRGKPKARKR